MMTERNIMPKKISTSSTKQEMLEAYNNVLKQLQEKSQVELKPEEEAVKKKSKEIVGVADNLSSEGAVKGIGSLRLEIGKMLTQLSDLLEQEVDKYKKVKQAIEVKEKEFQEIYEIDRSALTLAALIEVQSQKRKEFEMEMTAKKEALEREEQMVTAEREKENKLYESRIKERDIDGLRLRQKEKEEYEYAFKREQQLTRNKFEDEKLKLEKELQIKKEAMDKELLAREKLILEKEEKLNELEKKVTGFPKEIELSVNKAVKETADKIQLEARNKEELFKKSFEGERNVFLAKIESLERITKEQKEQVIKLSQQLENAYKKVEDIAVKTVEGAKSQINSQQAWMGEQIKKQSQEK
ncbi:MAG: hypothetical protein ABIH18_09625 [Candidatus Omnitrophota bacterium]